MGDCRDKALDLVGRRPHFRRELQQKLLDRGFPPSEVNDVLEDLARLGLLDDLQHAQDMATGYLTRKGFGPRRIRFELRRRGVEEQTAARVVAEVFEDPEEELRRARDVAGRKSLRGAFDRDRLARQLDRKGYSKAVILRVLREIGLEQGDGVDA